MRRCLRVRSFFAPQLVAAAAWQAQRFCSCEGAFDGIEVARVSSRRTPAMSKPSPPLSSSLTASTPTSTPIIPEPYDLHRDLIEVVFNPMTGHTVRTTSPQMRALARIGIAAVNGDLTVVNPVALRAFHHTLTTDPATASRDTADWPRKMRDTLTSLARTTDEHAFPDNVTALLGELVRKRIHSRVAASVVGELRPEDIATPAVLKEGQQRVLDLAVLGHHLYIGGTAGTGKTDVLRAVRKALLQQGLRVGTTATTGIAAANLGGVTYHSLLGVNRDGEVRKLSTLTTLDVLIIDEASMMDKASFEKLDQVLRRERNDTRPFGGVQIIICGDFLQLEAIPNKRIGDKGSKLQFIFESVVFADHFVKVMLTEQVRQASHPEFSEGLLQLRRGVWPEAFDNIIKMVPSSEVASDDEMLLFCRKDDVLRVNAEKMAQLSGRTVAFEPFQQIPTLSGTWTDSMLLSVTPEFNEEEFIASIYVAMAQKFRQFSRRDIVGYKYLSDGYVVRLRLPFDLEPAQLAGRKARFAELMRNIDTLAAGQATVLPRTLTADSLVPYDVETALAATIEAHPVAQRQELKVGARVMLRQNLTATLVNGSTGVIVDFVEASRENLAANIRQNQWLAAVLDTYVQQSHLQHGADIPLLPVVRFPGVADPIAIPPVPVVVGGDALTHYYEMSVINVPLVPAYASTTHKAQGLTLNCRVRVHLERMWDCNHIVYVALSRVRRADQLSISGLDKKKILVNPKAVEFDQLIPHAVDTRIDSETVSGSNWFAVDRVPSARATPSSSNANAASEIHTSPLLAKKQSDAARHASKASSGTNVAAHLRNRLKRNSASDKATQSKRIAAAAGMRPSFAAQRPFSLSGGPTTTSDD